MMLSWALATIIAVLFLSYHSSTADPFVECPKESSNFHGIVVPYNGSVGIRSYDWPNSMTNSSGTRRYGQCGFFLQSTSNQQLAMFFTNAHIFLNFPDGRFFDTNDQVNIQAAFSTDDQLIFFVRNETLNIQQNWLGFEAVVGAYDDEYDCPFTTGDEIVTVVENEPRVAASHWNINADFEKPLYVQCQWNFAPEPGYTLKLVFSVFDISWGGVVQLDEDKKTLFTVGTTGGDDNLPSQVFYTKKSFRLQYFKAVTSESVPNVNRFMAVVSAFPTKAASAQSSLCSANTTRTLTSDASFTNSDPSKTFLPYENSQECNWYINTVPNKQLQFYTSSADLENCCDTLTLRTNSNSTNLTTPSPYLHFVYTTVGAEQAELHWKSDGNYGRSGFEVKANVLDCTCSSPATIVLNAANKEATISPAASSKYYCPGMQCQWTISSPPNTLLKLEPTGSLRDCKTPACLSYSVKDSVEASDGTTNVSLMSSPSTFFFGKSVSVKFQSSPIPITFLEENGDLKIGVSYLGLSTFTDKNTAISLHASKPSMFYNTVNLKEQYSSVTFTLSSQKDGTKLQLYPLQIQSPNSPTSIVIIDGDLHSPAAVTSLQALVPISSYSGHTTPVNPFISTTGKITVLLLSTPDSTQSPKDLNEFFIKVYDDSKDCDESNSVYYVDLSVQHFVESKSTKLDRCPLTLIKQRNADPNSVVTIGVNNVDGTDKDVKVLPGSSDLDVTPFYEFNQKNQAKWANVMLLGDVFTVLIPVGGKLNFTTSLMSIPDNTTIYGDSYLYGNSQNGIFMSPNYPNGDDSKSDVIRGLSIISYAKKFKVEIDVVVGKLSKTSSLEVLFDRNSVLASLNDVKDLEKTYTSDYVSNIMIRYTAIKSSGEEGFFLRYKLTPKNGSLASLSGVVTLFAVLYSLLSS